MGEPTKPGGSIRKSYTAFLLRQSDRIQKPHRIYRFTGDKGFTSAKRPSKVNAVATGNVLLREGVEAGVDSDSDD